MLSIEQPKINVLNVCENPVQHQKSAVDISKELQKSMLRMKTKYMSDDGNEVDYKSLQNSQLFDNYTSSTFDLHCLDLETLSEEEKQAFFINIYNALTIHGLTSCKTLPASVLDVQLFWKVTAYQIGNNVFSLDDIEHGILRANRPCPSSKEPQFKAGDPRLKYVVKKRDPRIHFALVCGAVSCPAIQVYSAENLNRALEAATKTFCEQEVKVYEIQREIRVSQLLQWYCVDFGENDVEAVRWTIPYLSEKKAKSLEGLLYKMVNEGMVDLNYTKYNWLINDKSENRVEVNPAEVNKRRVGGSGSPRDTQSSREVVGGSGSPRDTQSSTSSNNTLNLGSGMAVSSQVEFSGRKK